MDTTFQFVESMRNIEPENTDHIERIRYLNNRAQIRECLDYIETDKENT